MKTNGDATLRRVGHSQGLGRLILLTRGQEAGGGQATVSSTESKTVHCEGFRLTTGKTLQSKAWLVIAKGMRSRGRPLLNKKTRTKIKGQSLLVMRRLLTSTNTNGIRSNCPAKAFGISLTFRKTANCC